MLEENKWKYRSDWQLKALIENSAKHNRWNEVEEFAQELQARKNERLAKITS